MGVVVNTNGSWIARRLTSLGFYVDRIIVVRDSRSDVEEEVRRAVEKRIKLLVTTGGLGPTYDDSTASFIASALNRKLVLNKNALELVKKKYESMGVELTSARLKQAYMPEGARVIPNPVGTAPGFIVEMGDTIIVSLPGVPREMKKMFEEYVEKEISRITGYRVASAWLVIRGAEESSIAEIIEEKAREHPEAYIKTHPIVLEDGSFYIRLQVSTASKNYREAEEKARSIALDVKKELCKRGFNAELMDRANNC